MLGVSGIISSTSGDGAATAAAAAAESGGAASGGSSEVGGGALAVTGGFMEEGERSCGGGNRWPRPETLALLKIRSEMDVVFRDSSLKGPLWEEVSRKMADLGFHRSAKKCKEKFENVYKYHKRTREGRASKADGKTYRFFDQLEALESNPSHPLPLALPRPPPPPLEATPITMAMPMPGNASMNVQVSMPQGTTVSSTPNPFAASAQNTVQVSQQQQQQQVVHNIQSSMTPSSQQPTLMQHTPVSNQTPSHHQVNTNFPSHHHNLTLSYSTSSSTSSDEDIQRRHKKKRKWKDFFEKLMKDVIDKQDQLQRKFLETLEKRERDRMVREEAWKVQEMARMSREHDLLVQERSMAAAKDAAVIAFLQKVTENQNIQIPNSTNNAATIPPPPLPQIQIQVPVAPPPHSQPPPTTPPVSVLALPPAPAPTTAVSVPMSQSMAITPITSQQLLQIPPKMIELPKSDNGGESFSPASGSRWPKAEVEALIKLRTQLDVKYQENGPKGPLWEDISAGMRKLGYNRNAKRCKEKWENINKYFKKVKESNKKRPEDSKTCPYFYQLEALYKEKAKNDTSTGFSLKPEINPMVPIMARPEQQWPLPQHHQMGIHDHDQDHDHNHGSDNMDQNDNEDDNDDDDEEEEEDEENAYEIVTSKQQMATTTTTTTATTTTV